MLYYKYNVINLQDYLPVPSIPIHYHKVIFLAASKDKLSLYSSIPPIPEKKGLNDIPSGPFKNPIVYRIFERMSSHDERILKQLCLNWTVKRIINKGWPFLIKVLKLSLASFWTKRDKRMGLYSWESILPSVLFRFFPSIFVSKFIPPWYLSAVSSSYSISTIRLYLEIHPLRQVEPVFNLLLPGQR